MTEKRNHIIYSCTHRPQCLRILTLKRCLFLCFQGGNPALQVPVSESQCPSLDHVWRSSSESGQVDHFHHRSLHCRNEFLGKLFNYRTYHRWAKDQIFLSSGQLWRYPSRSPQVHTQLCWTFDCPRKTDVPWSLALVHVAISIILTCFRPGTWHVK